MVKLWNKQVKDEKPRPDRIKNMSDYDLRSWLNTCLMELGATYDRWAYHGGDPDEVNQVMELTDALWAEIRSRL
jgi:hypothetical protein